MTVIVIEHSHERSLLLKVPLPVGASGERWIVEASESIEGPVHCSHVRVVVRSPDLKRMILTPTVHLQEGSAGKETGVTIGQQWLLVNQEKLGSDALAPVGRTHPIAFWPALVTNAEHSL